MPRERSESRTTSGTGVQVTGLSPGTSSGQSAAVYYQPEDCSSRTLRMPRDSRLFSHFLLQIRCFFPFFFKSLGSRRLPLWDDVVVFSFLSLIAAFCRDRRGILRLSEGLPSLIARSPLPMSRRGFISGSHTVISILS